MRNFQSNHINERTCSPVEEMELRKIRAHSKSCCVVIHAQHILIRISRIQKNPEPCQQEHGSRQFVIPIQNKIIRNHIKRPGILGNSRICRQGNVGTVSGGIIQPGGTPHVFIKVASGVVVWLDVRVPSGISSSSAAVSGEVEQCFGSFDQLLGVRRVVPENDGGSCQSSRHFPGEIRSCLDCLYWSWIVHVFGSHPTVVIIWR